MPEIETVRTGHWPGSATAHANINVALIKYWGKADERLIIPRVSSLSLTLAGLGTTTTVSFAPEGTARDTLTIDGRPKEGAPLARVTQVLDLVRARAGITARAAVTSSSTVPYGAGLASSASAFAALAAAAAAAAGLHMAGRELSRLARRGSGSACRSVFPGLVLWHAGHDDASSYAEPVNCPIDLAMCVVMISRRRKPMSSREAMRLTARTSPLYDAWIRACTRDLAAALAAVHTRDVAALGAVCEANALTMHGTIMASRPPVIFWAPETLAAFAAVRALRDSGLGAWATVDAGPNVKVLSAAADAPQVSRELRRRLPGVSVRVCRPGDGVRIVTGDAADGMVDEMADGSGIG